MPHAEAHITIARPVKAVYDFVLKGENNSLWRPSVVDIERVPGKPAVVGAVFKQGLKGFLGRRIAGDYELTQCCLLYTSDAADDLLCVELGGGHTAKMKKK